MKKHIFAAFAIALSAAANAQTQPGGQQNRNQWNQLPDAKKKEILAEKERIKNMSEEERRAYFQNGGGRPRNGQKPSGTERPTGGRRPRG